MFEKQLLPRLREILPSRVLALRVFKIAGRSEPEVDALRRRHGLPGMKVLQFAFSGEPDNSYLPFHHRADSAVYTVVGLARDGKYGTLGERQRPFFYRASFQGHMHISTQSFILRSSHDPRALVHLIEHLEL